jgi:hypothetical protein
VGVLYLVTLACAICVFVVLLTPRLVFREWVRARIWALRDEVADAQLSDKLPFEHPATVELMERIDRTGDYSSLWSIGHLLLGVYCYGMLTEDEKRRSLSDTPGLEEFDEMQRSLYEDFDRRLTILRVRLVAVGSCPGLILTMLITPLVAVGSILFTPDRRVDQARQTFIVRTQDRADEVAYELRSSRDHRQLLGV